MNATTNRHIRKTLGSMMMLIMMLIGGSMNALAQDEKVIYSTNFQDWDAADVNQDSTSSRTNIDKTTTDGQQLTFSLNNSIVVPTGTNTKFTGNVITVGYLRAEKTTEGNKTMAFFKTSILKSVTKVKFVQAATGGSDKRGWNVAYRIVGETDWTIVHNTPVGTASGISVSIDINKENVELRFFNRYPSENAYMTSLEIDGFVDSVNTARVAYYDTDGTTMIGENVINAEGNAKYPKLLYKYDANNITMEEGYVFRGWFNGPSKFATKVREGTDLYCDISLYAKATPKEEALDGTEYTYDMRMASWYSEDHELIDFDNKGAYSGAHGWLIKKNGTFKIDVASYAQINITQCKSGSNGQITVIDSDGNEIAKLDNRASAEDVISTISYQGGKPTTLTFTVSNNTYIHALHIVNFRPVYATFKFANDNIKGACPDKIRGNNKGEIEMPGNVFFYRPGWTFAGWTDGTKTYETGKTYTFSDDVTLYPKMIENTIDITETDIPVNAVWPLDHTKAPILNATNTSTPIVYTRTLTVVDEKQDIALTIDAKSGGVVNTDNHINDLNDGAEGAAVYDGTKFRLRAVYGMTVQIHASDKIDTNNKGNTTVFGDNPNNAKISLNETDNEKYNITVSDDGKTLTLEYYGDATTIELTAENVGSQQDYGFLKDITAIYPTLPDVWAKGVIIDKDPTKFPNEKDENAGIAKILSETSYPNTGNRYKVGDVITVVTIPNYGYQITGYRVSKGLGTSFQELPSKEFTDPETGEKYLSAKYTVTQGQTIIEALYKHVSILHKVVIKPSDTELGTVTISPIYENFYNEVYETNEDGTKGKKKAVECWYTEGTKVTTSTVAETGYVIDYWTEEGNDTHITDANSYTFTMGTTDRSFIVNFKQGEIGTVIFDISDSHVSGLSVADQHHNAISAGIAPINNVRSFTVPTNYTFFKDVDENDVMTDNSYTLQYWVDKDEQGNRYELGNTYSFKKKLIILIPVFAYNPTTRTNRVNNPLIRYDFGNKVYSYYDPTSGQQRNTCAQEVNIGNNVNTFWTAQGYFEILNNGFTVPHIRDVALEINTGKYGFIKNEGFGDWCAFGPGTTLWCTSSVGTKVSMLTYSKITTTTIDGVVPTLDDERTATERRIAGTNNIYVYSYTTQNSATRMPIVIGDDYSYYQWIEVAMRAANLVNLHVNVDNSQHGVITKVQSLSDYGATELENGGYAFRRGDRVRMTFNRKFGFELDKLTSPSQTDATGNPLQLIKMKDDGSVDMIDEDLKIHNVPRNADGSWGTASGEGKTVFVIRTIEQTGVTATDSIRTTYEVEYDITAHRNIEIVFKEKPTYYITYNPGKLATGIAPVAQWVEAGDKFTAHKNQTLYYEGNTLDHWVDIDYNESMNDDEKAKHIYYTGQVYTAPAMDLRLSPVFTPNSFNILNITKESTATWYLTKGDGSPEINYENTAGILVTQLYNENKYIDMKIDLDAVDHGSGRGKFNNISSDERIQINANSIIKFQSTPNCMAKFVVVSKDPSVAVVAGKKNGDEGYTLSADKKSIEVVCSGDTAEQRLQLVGDGVYGKYFAITYKPQTASKATIEKLTCGETTYNADDIKHQMDIDGHITFTVSPWKNANEEIPIITGTATEGGTVIVTKGTVTVPQATATVRTSAGITVETYPIVFTFTQPDNYPTFKEIIVNGITKSGTDNEFDNVPNSGIITVTFDRTMAATTIKIDELNIVSTAESGKSLSFRYWDLPAAGTIKLNITPDLGIFKDIYGKTCQQSLILTMHIQKNSQQYNHNKFDFVVGTNGNMDEAIAAANSNTKADGERYYIFVPDGEWMLNGNVGNGMTKIAKPNISIIGQSKNGTTIWNNPTQEGISITGTIYIDRNLNDFYCEDLTLENRYDYWGSAGGAGRAVAFFDRGTRSILKNVGLKSYQDTYYSNNSDAGFRGYFESCDFWGLVDFICGNGDIWFEKCNLILRDRSGNNICAPSQNVINHLWGYVFNNCTIKPEVDNPQQLKGKDWTLARPWGDSPAATYINTTMLTRPTDAGWQKMTTGLKLRLHEYRSMDANSNLISLGSRTLAACTPGTGSDDCVLSAAQAEKYTLRNVLGGNDAFEPNELCKQIDAVSAAEEDKDENSITWNDSIEIDDDILQWHAQEEALCYFIFKLNDNGEWIYKANTAETSIDLTDFGSGRYCVRAANQRGGLGAATESILYMQQDPYELVIKQLDDLTVDGVPYGYSTICLPFNARVPEEVTVYAATAHNKVTDEDKVEDFIMTLTPVEFIDSEKGYVVYGPAGKHYFTTTSRKCNKETILTGNATEEPISTVNKSGYVLANKSWGLGFYKYTGTTYAPFRAWLPEDMVSNIVQDALAAGTRAIRLFISDETTHLHTPLYFGNSQPVIYDLSGKRIESPSRQGIYIIHDKGKTMKKSMK